MPRLDTRYYGIRACLALAEARPLAVERAFYEERTAPIFSALSRDLAKRRRPYRVVGPEELAKVAGTRHHEGVCLVADPPPGVHPGELADAAAEGDLPARWIFLDGVENPHNVGAILRSAAHFGGAALAGLDGELPEPSGALARVAEGGVEHVPLFSWQDPGRAFERLRDHGFAAIAAVTEGGDPVYDVALPRRCVFLLGAEGEGLSGAAIAAAERSVRIPGTGAVQSLNVAAACAVLLAEHARQHPL